MPVPIDGSARVAVVDKPRRLSEQSLVVSRADIRSASSNQAEVLIGGPAVRAVATDQRGFLLVAKAVLTLENVDLAEWYLDGTVVGDYVFWGAWV